MVERVQNFLVFYRHQRIAGSDLHSVSFLKYNHFSRTECHYYRSIKLNSVAVFDNVTGNPIQKLNYLNGMYTLQYVGPLY